MKHLLQVGNQNNDELYLQTLLGIFAFQCRHILMGGICAGISPAPRKWWVACHKGEHHGSRNAQRG